MKAKEIQTLPPGSVVRLPHLNEAPHHPDCPAIDGFGCHCGELWEQEIYADDYSLDEPPQTDFHKECA
jgi:hypothetical protein